MAVSVMSWTTTCTYQEPVLFNEVVGTPRNVPPDNFLKTTTGLENFLLLPLISLPIFSPILHHHNSPSLNTGGLRKILCNLSFKPNHSANFLITPIFYSCSLFILPPKVRNFLSISWPCLPLGQTSSGPLPGGTPCQRQSFSISRTP